MGISAINYYLEQNPKLIKFWQNKLILSAYYKLCWVTCILILCGNHVFYPNMLSCFSNFHAIIYIYIYKWEVWNSTSSICLLLASSFWYDGYIMILVKKQGKLGNPWIMTDRILNERSVLCFFCFFFLFGWSKVDINHFYLFSKIQSVDI